MTGELENIRQRLLPFFQRKPIIKAYLFGSYAREEANEESDIDILVELDYSQIIGWEFLSWKNEIEELLQKKVDLVSVRGISKHLQPLIEKERQILYAR
ncbi:nucleotidyltransferase family protein [Raineya orbicola]|jgi:predicted nucleotidyltransferase|uniref:Putative nucleotidyltransferase n=1 Tax=Raineya orbicola TaxID=2016530 RepID=A0A2N3IJU1_9BACT|nr:nucleotidyltransferase domain-containing protein [Raineya orbicola]PKQ70584.1 putative nucleotidyltransferase [Raineya orbicola]